MAEPIITGKGTSLLPGNAQEIALNNAKNDAARKCHVSPRDIDTSSFSEGMTCKSESDPFLGQTWTCNVNLFAKDAKELCAKITTPEVYVTIGSQTRSFIEGKGWKFEDGTMYQTDKELCNGQCEVDFRGGPDTGGYNKSVKIERLPERDPAYGNNVLITVVEFDESKHTYVLNLETAKIKETTSEK